MGDAIGDVEEASAKDGRCSVHFPTLRCYAQGWDQRDFEPVPAGQAETPSAADARRGGGTASKRVAT